MYELIKKIEERKNELERKELEIEKKQFAMSCSGRADGSWR